jgi:excisionase family DNA binding protein
MTGREDDLADLESLTIEEVGRAEKVKPEEVRRWIARGILRAYRLPGGQIRVSKTEFEAFRGRRPTR